MTCDVGWSLCPSSEPVVQRASSVQRLGLGDGSGNRNRRASSLRTQQHSAGRCSRRISIARGAAGCASRSAVDPHCALGHPPRTAKCADVCVLRMFAWCERTPQGGSISRRVLVSTTLPALRCCETACLALVKLHRTSFRRTRLGAAVVLTRALRTQQLCCLPKDLAT